jgi:bifunctional non-homologous end joining protein LigD
VAPAPAGRLSFVEPQLATLVAEPPRGTEWAHEVKFDGYRLACLVAGGRARLLTRRGLDWTARFPVVAQRASSLRARQAMLDGEIVALLPDGRSSFQGLQQALSGEAAERVVYYAFDLLRLDGKDLRALPLSERKARLARLLRASPRDRRQTLRYSEHVAGRGTAVLAKACRMGLEGIVSKRLDAPYRSGRGRTWLKIKCSNRQEFVVVGFTEPRGARSGVGALLLGVYDDENGLRYAGKVGTGMSTAVLQALRGSLERLRRETPPLAGGAERGLGVVHWVQPRLVVEVGFTEWTADGRLRHPSFVGVREDKPARTVRRERPAR